MIAEIRTYIANRGMLDGLIATLNEVVFPNHAAFGIQVVGLWADRKQNEVTWIRVFASPEDRDARLAAYESSDGRKANLPRMVSHLARPPEVRIMEDVFALGTMTEAGNARPG
ncbi:MAG TPA: hypothetical protein VHA82_15620 [Ramlibacter sp.]|uniref:hypothetical protein n=1 Tax=Ramlibacter sp. TaxID=1917967 RepID=UPI002BFB950B|nr:hypothetical protein [Ramlibacter sp.]HVZ45238.1 hypothetical protein [Ramlibacter sp.]